MNRLSIHSKVTALTFFIVCFSLLLAGIVLVGNAMKSKKEDLQEKSMLTARTVAELPYLKEKITGSSFERGSINEIVERMRIVNNANYIVVLDMKGTRLSHPVKKKLGMLSHGKDEGPAFAENSYTSLAKGEIGTVIRSFVPVMGNNHEQVGVVIAGYKMPSFGEVLFDVKVEIWITGALCLLFGGWGAWLLAQHVRKQMFSLEPHEIARLFVERTETFNAMHEGVIAINNEEKITIFNDKAKQMIGITGNVNGLYIQDVIPDTYLTEILRLNRPIFNKELQLGNISIMSNRVPIVVNARTVGALAIFQDRTEVKKMAEELTGVKAYVSALRVQNHEHMNKLHTIAGLIQLGNKEKALDYVFHVTEEQEELMSFLMKRIKDDNVSGLLLSKVSRGRELGIEVNIDRNSTLNQLPAYLDHHDAVIILGNLIENAFDSFKNMKREEKEIYISIEQNAESLSILIEDNGCGIHKKDLPFLFDQGFSTKGESGRGIGLYLIREMVQKGNGTIDVETEVGKGSSFVITLATEGRKNNVQKENL
jgi:two-component system sensor histidine kinase DctS